MIARYSQTNGLAFICSMKRAKVAGQRCSFRPNSSPESRGVNARPVGRRARAAPENDRGRRQTTYYPRSPARSVCFSPRPALLRATGRASASPSAGTVQENPKPGTLILMSRRRSPANFSLTQNHGWPRCWR